MKKRFFKRDKHATNSGNTFSHSYNVKSYEHNIPCYSLLKIKSRMKRILHYNATRHRYNADIIRCCLSTAVTLYNSHVNEYVLLIYKCTFYFRVFAIAEIICSKAKRFQCSVELNDNIYSTRNIFKYIHVFNF